MYTPLKFPLKATKSLLGSESTELTN